MSEILQGAPADAKADVLRSLQMSDVLQVARDQSMAWGVSFWFWKANVIGSKFGPQVSGLSKAFGILLYASFEDHLPTTISRVHSAPACKAHAASRPNHHDDHICACRPAFIFVRHSM